MVCHVGNARKNELGSCDFIDVAGVYWFSLVLGCGEVGTVDWCFLYAKLRFFALLTGSFGFAVILTDTAFSIRGH